MFSDEFYAEIPAERLGRQASGLSGRRQAAGVEGALTGEIQPVPVADGRVVQRRTRFPVAHVTSLEGAAIALVGERGRHVGHRDVAQDVRNHFAERLDETLHGGLFLLYVGSVLFRLLPEAVGGPVKQAGDDGSALRGVVRFAGVVVHDKGPVEDSCGFERTGKDDLHRTGPFRQGSVQAQADVHALGGLQPLAHPARPSLLQGLREQLVDGRPCIGGNYHRIGLQKASGGPDGPSAGLFFNPERRGAVTDLPAQGRERPGHVPGHPDGAAGGVSAVAACEGAQGVNQGKGVDAGLDHGSQQIAYLPVGKTFGIGSRGL